MSEGGDVIVFDGVCVLCSYWARFVLRYDTAGRFRLAAMQRSAGAALARRFGIDPSAPTTILLVRGERALRDSDAILHILATLGWPWRVLALARIVPRGLRDAVYRLVARNRYRLFGRRDACWLPPADASWRFL